MLLSLRTNNNNNVQRGAKQGQKVLCNSQGGVGTRKKYSEILTAAVLQNLQQVLWCKKFENRSAFSEVVGKNISKSVKKQATIILPITSPNVDWFYFRNSFTARLTVNLLNKYVDYPTMHALSV